MKLRVDSIHCGSITLSDVTVREIRDLLNMVKYKAGDAVTENCCTALQNMLTWSADEGFEGRNFGIGVPDHIRKLRQIVLDTVIEHFGKCHPVYQQADELTWKLINKGYAHGEKLRKFEFLRDTIEV
ncbi:MAG: hypothetical protein IKG57_06285 [Enterococcus sp.]|uniref:hypothetical protein n=1 Tax=Enterococcus sp. TaxID=35783 RepID=UPI002579D440|nr:hypothetical protein [Enterococcus sp.]MBR3047768.1 hypothetical protein [Enterococcus sp.]